MSLQCEDTPPWEPFCLNRAPFVVLSFFDIRPQIPKNCRRYAKRNETECKSFFQNIFNWMQHNDQMFSRCVRAKVSQFFGIGVLFSFVHFCNICIIMLYSKHCLTMLPYKPVFFFFKLKSVIFTYLFSYNESKSPIIHRTKKAQDDGIIWGLNMLAAAVLCNVLMNFDIHTMKFIRWNVDELWNKSYVIKNKKAYSWCLEASFLKHKRHDALCCFSTFYYNFPCFSGFLKFPSSTSERWCNRV